MEKNIIRANILLFIASFIWGFAFVAQRKAMEHVGPFTFNTFRFILGFMSVYPSIIYFDYRRKQQNQELIPFNDKNLFLGGMLAGLVLFFAISFQQAGLVYTEAGKAGFITGLYLVLVPVLGIFIGKKTTVKVWLAVILSIIGLFLMSIKENFYISFGDILLILGAFAWAIHVLVISKFSPKTDTLKLAFFQFLICSMLSAICTVILEKIDLEGLIKAIIPILYAGIISAGIAYTFQIVGQKYVHPAKAAIILGFEAVFAVIGGLFILNETISIKGAMGCLFMFSGIILSQLPEKKIYFSRKKVPTCILN